MPLVWTHQVEVAGALVGQGEADAQSAAATGSRAAVGVDQGHLDAGDAGEQPGHAAADHAGTDDGDPVADQRARRPRARSRRSRRSPASTARRGRHVVGNDGHGLGRHDVRRLVGVEAEDGAAEQVVGPGLDHADAEVAVLHRARAARPPGTARASRRTGSRARRRGRPAPRCRGSRRTRRARTSTSPGPGSGRSVMRISPDPGSRSQ